MNYFTQSVNVLTIANNYNKICFSSVDTLYMIKVWTGNQGQGVFKPFASNLYIPTQTNKHLTMNQKNNLESESVSVISSIENNVNDCVKIVRQLKINNSLKAELLDDLQQSSLNIDLIGELI